MPRFIFFTLLLLFFKKNHAQDITYSYINYTTKEGLAGNNVYCAEQDKDGFIWFGTETGLSRFDGTNFKTYTVKEGLPDNEIINIFCDSRGRVWFAPFTKSVCYYYKGKIHNQINDTLLKKMDIKNSIIGFCEDANGSIYLNQYNSFSKITIEGTLIDFDFSFEKYNISISKAIALDNGGVKLLHKKNIVELYGNKTLKKNINFLGSSINSTALNKKFFVVDNDHYTTKNDYKYIYNFEKNTLDSIKSNHDYINHNIINDSLLAVNSKMGCTIFNLKNLKEKPLIFLNGISTTNVFVDNELEYWFLSKKKGIFKLANSNVFNIKESKNSKLEIKSINKIDNKIFFTTEDGSIYNYETRKTILDFRNSNIIPQKKATYILKYKNKDCIYYTEDNIYLNKKIPIVDGSIKKVSLINDSFLIISSSSRTRLLNLINKKMDILWNDRSTTHLAIDSSLYIGTLKGLVYIPNFYKTVGNLKHILTNRISSIAKGYDNIVWIGTYDSGIIGVKNGIIIKVINEKNGLSSNICRTLYTDGSHLWVGTNNGLNKINISKYPYNFETTYTTSDGLASNIINTILKENNTIYVGTAEGLTFFDEDKISKTSTCKIKILSYFNSGKEKYWDKNQIILKNNENNIRFNFVGFSYKSSGDINYSYRLIGLDTIWKNTKENYLEFPTLPSGNYTFQIQAINKFNIKSEILNIEIKIEKKLIEKNWFKLLSLLLIIGFLIVLYKVRIKKIKNKTNEKIKLANKINEFEQMALRSQMNPHFIFNCLNSLQSYVIKSDLKGANNYISNFSKLLRSTLENSSKKSISLNDEIDYLTRYLVLEEIRFEDKFTFSVNVNKNVDVFNFQIPPMLLQPYIENAIRHGINNKNDNSGLININFFKETQNLICEIIDNGIGRNASKKLKGIVNIEYQSKGMELTEKRAKLISKNLKNSIEIIVEDFLEPQTGTKVIVKIPNEININYE